MADQLNGLASAASAALPTPISGSLTSSSGDQPAERMHLIDEEQQFSSHLAAYLSKWQLAEAGFGYNLCAVLGSQSTGKSTLLNRLFGTSFDVMDESQRRQTTKGEWA